MLNRADSVGILGTPPVKMFQRHSRPGTLTFKWMRDEKFEKIEAKLDSMSSALSRVRGINVRLRELRLGKVSFQEGLVNGREELSCRTYTKLLKAFRLI